MRARSVISSVLRLCSDVEDRPEFSADEQPDLLLARAPANFDVMLLDVPRAPRGHG